MNSNNCCEIRNIFRTFEFCLIDEGIFCASQILRIEWFFNHVEDRHFFCIKAFLRPFAFDLFPLSRNLTGMKAKATRKTLQIRRLSCPCTLLCLDQSLKKISNSLKNKKDRRPDSFCRKSMNLKFQAR